MFLCQPCHEKYNCQWSNHFMGSRGPCEDCGKPSICVDCRAQPKQKKGERQKKNKPVFTVELVEKNYHKLRPVWEPFAKKAVDRAFASVAKEYKITDWKKDKVGTNFDGWTTHPYNLALDQLELDFWEQDVGWEGEEQAYEAMCKKMKMGPDLEEGVTETMLTCAGKWANAWNRYQRAYAKATYGVDINFGTEGEA